LSLCFAVCCQWRSFVLIEIETMLYTNLKHIETSASFTAALRDHRHVVVVCGRMGVQSVPVYRIVEVIEQQLTDVAFFDMEIDNPVSAVVTILFEPDSATSLPLVIYYRNGVVVGQTTGVQTQKEIISNCTNLFPAELKSVLVQN